MSFFLSSFLPPLECPFLSLSLSLSTSTSPFSPLLLLLLLLRNRRGDQNSPVGVLVGVRRGSVPRPESERDPPVVLALLIPPQRQALRRARALPETVQSPLPLVREPRRELYVLVLEDEAEPAGVE